MRGRLTFVVCVFALALACATLAFGVPKLVDSALAGESTVVVNRKGEVREYGYGLVRFNHHGPEWHRWHRIVDKRELKADLDASQAENRRLRASLKREWAPKAMQMAKIACAAYRQIGSCDPNLVYRQIDCETGGTFDPWAKNRRSTASGWGQFIRSTWQGTLFAEFSVFDPMANVLAIAKAHATGNGESPNGPWFASRGCWLR